MPYRFPIVITFILFLTATVGAGTLFASAAPYLESKSRLEILLGKLCVMAPEGRLGQIKLKSTGRVKFRFSLTPDPVGTADFSYYYFNKNCFGRIECQNGFTLHEFWADLPSEKYLRYQQPGNGRKITLEFGTLTEQMLEKIRNADENEDWTEISGRDVQVWQARSFWEFLFSYSTECNDALLFLLSKHWENANQKISNYRRMFMEVLIQNARERLAAPSSQTLEPLFPENSPKENRKLLLDLASDDFTVRRNADLALRRLGPEIFFLIDELDWQNFAPETQLRLKNILSATEDDFSLAEKSLTWDSRSLIDSPEIWLGVLEFGVEEQKRIAWRFLSKNADVFFENPSDFHAAALLPNDSSDSFTSRASTDQTDQTDQIDSKRDAVSDDAASLQSPNRSSNENLDSEESTTPDGKPPKSSAAPSSETEPSPADVPTPNAVWFERLDKIKKLSLKNQETTK